MPDQCAYHLCKRPVQAFLKVPAHSVEWLGITGLPAQLCLYHLLQFSRAIPDAYVLIPEPQT